MAFDNLKLVLVGDAKVGKSSLCNKCCYNIIPDPSDYIPTVCKYCFLLLIYYIAEMFGERKFSDVFVHAFAKFLQGL